MRLVRYINESNLIIDSWDLSKEEIVDRIEKDCSKFLKERPRGVEFYRGLRTIDRSMGNLFKMDVRKDRRPRDTNIKVHKWVNKLFYERFGWYPRTEGVFTTTSIQTAKTYGNLYQFFPIGDYKYVFSSEVGDSFDFLPRKLDFNNKLIKKDIERAEEKVKNEYQDKNLGDVGISTEVIWKCDSYYLVDRSIII